MKDDQLPECYVEANDNHFVCYVFEYSDEENMYVEYNSKFIDDFEVEEVVRTCKFCGQQDVSYPV
jgi:hypothetical protein